MRKYIHWVGDRFEFISKNLYAIEFAAQKLPSIGTLTKIISESEAILVLNEWPSQLSTELPIGPKKFNSDQVCFEHCLGLARLSKDSLYIVHCANTHTSTRRYDNNKVVPSIRMNHCVRTRGRAHLHRHTAYAFPLIISFNVNFAQLSTCSYLPSISQCYVVMWFFGWLTDWLSVAGYPTNARRYTDTPALANRMRFSDRAVGRSQRGRLHCVRRRCRCQMVHRTAGEQNDTRQYGLLGIESRHTDREYECEYSIIGRQ